MLIFGEAPDNLFASTNLKLSGIILCKSILSNTLIPRELIGVADLSEI